MVCRRQAMMGMWTDTDLPASPAGGPLVPAKQTQPAGIPMLIKEGDTLEIYEEEKIKRSI